MSFPGQVVQFGTNLIGGLLGGQGFDTSRWPARDPQGFVRQEAETWKPFELTQPKGGTPELGTLLDTGDRQTNALINYAEIAAEKNARRADALLRMQMDEQRNAAQNFTGPALAFKEQMGLLRAMASRPQQPINGLAWLPDPKNQVLPPPLA
jgi:hypothetical protein